MAVVFANAQGYTRTDSLCTGAFSFCAWVYRTSNNSGDNIVMLGHNGGSETVYTGIGRNGSGYCVIFDSTTAYSQVTSPTFGLNAWYFIAYAQPAASNGQVWIWDSSGTMGTASSGSVRPLAGNTYLRLTDLSTYGMIGRLAGVKFWDAVLTESEFAAERLTLRPLRTSNLYIWSPFVAGADTADYSGNGRTWTDFSTPTSGDGPPVGWGAAPYIIGNPAAGRVIGPGTIWPTVTM